MPLVDISAILQPVSIDAPAGIDLEEGHKHDPAFAEMERIALGKPEQQIGNTLIAAEPPDWKMLQRKATELLARSKDLRAATHLARSLLHTDGWQGFAQGLEVLHALVGQYWDDMYPRLDPEDDNDPTMRINILMSITDSTVLSAIRNSPLVTSRSLGRFSLKDLEAASLETTTDTHGEPGGAMASIEAAVMDADVSSLEQALAAVRAALESLSGLEAELSFRVTSADSISFNKLGALFHKAEGFLAPRVARRSPVVANGSTANGAAGLMANGAAHGAGQGAGGGDGMGASSGSEAGLQAGQAGWASGGIRSREDVMRALDAICAYYERYEPSSPIPLFMARCKRLVTMSFVDIVRDLVPDALAQVDVLRGRVE